MQILVFLLSQVVLIKYHRKYGPKKKKDSKPKSLLIFNIRYFLISNYGSPEKSDSRKLNYQKLISSANSQEGCSRHQNVTVPGCRMSNCAAGKQGVGELGQ